MDKSIESRVAGLEKSARRWRITAVVSLVGIVIATVLGAGKPVAISEEVNTRLLRVLNANGKPVLIVGTNEAGQSWFQFQDDGKDAITMMSTDGITALRVHNLSGNPDAVVMTEKNMALFTSSLSKRKVGASIGTKDGAGVISVMDANGKLLVP